MRVNFYKCDICAVVSVLQLTFIIVVDWCSVFFFLSLSFSFLMFVCKSLQQFSFHIVCLFLLCLLLLFVCLLNSKQQQPNLLITFSEHASQAKQSKLDLSAYPFERPNKT